MIKAIIWDMDGVLIDSETHKINAEIALLKEHGVDLTMEVAKSFLGMEMKEYFSELAEYFKVTLPIEDMMTRYNELMKEYYEAVFPMVPHAKIVLEEMNDVYDYGLATSSSRDSAIIGLNKFELMDFFRAATFGTDVIFGKPNPEIFLRTAEELGIKPGEIVVVEDSVNGFTAAKDAGMRVVARRAGHNSHQDFSLADFVIEDLLDLPKVLKKFS